MSKHKLETTPDTMQPSNITPQRPQQASVRVIAICTLIYMLCTLVSVAPLLHLAGKTFLLALPSNPFLLWWGSWLPSNLHLAQTYRASMITTNTIEFLLLIVLTFIAYGLCAYAIRRQPEQRTFTNVIRLLWLGTIVIGLIYVFTPAMLSRDIFVYAGYGRTIAAHHANPYFVTPSAFPQDPITAYDDWKFATSAYGPFWLFVCAAWALLLGSSPLVYLLAYRLFDLALHLLNTLLIATFLKRSGRSPRTIALGTLLYAWNPLALMESSLGGHNDTFLVTLLLLGIFLSLRAEQRSFSRFSDYLPPVIAFTLAALVKFTAAPIIGFYIVLLAYRIFHPAPSIALQDATKQAAYRKVFLFKTLLTCTVSGFVALACYGPFWIRHSLHDIVSSFSSPPSSYYSENSILRAIYNNIRAHGLPSRSSWMYLPTYVLSLHVTWNILNLVVLLCIVGIGIRWLWHTPTTRTLLFAALATLGTLLLVTPWFFSWYVTWLVGLAAACLPARDNKKARALIAFSITFSATAFLTYLFNGYPPVGEWGGLSWMLMNIPPICAFLFCYLSRLTSKSSAEDLTDRHRLTING